MRDLRFMVIRICFVLLFLGITLLQFFSFPGQFQHMRRVQGFSLFLEFSLTLVVGLWLLCGQIALICLWKIVRAMQTSTFFTPQNYVWIRRLLFSLEGACIMPIALFVIIAPRADDPGNLVVLLILTLFFLTLTLTTSLLKDQIAEKTFSTSN